MRQNLVEKIVQRFATGPRAARPVRSGDLLAVRPAHVLTHDNTAPVIAKLRSMAGAAARVADPAQPVIALDHDVQNESAENLAKYRAIEAFAAEQGLCFHPARRGIGHQVMCEEGFVLPGTLVVASDSHANLYGGLGALGTPVVRTDAAAIWATGETWFHVPPVTRVVLHGELRPGVAGKDVIVTLCGRFERDEVLNHALEVTGPGALSLSIDDRLAIANMTTEWGALAAVFPGDERALAWLAARLEGRSERGDLTRERLDELRASPLVADEDARYAQTITVELDRVTPSVAGPNQVKRVTPLAALARERVAIQKAYLLSCVNGRASDFAEAAEALGGARVADGVELWIAAASAEVEAESKRRGDWQELVAAGARELPPGCGPCIGLGAGLLKEGEVGISATNRNFEGRMGARGASVYLASPAVVAASAAAGRIAAPASRGAEAAESDERDVAALELHAPAEPRVLEPSELLPGFPRTLRGEILFLDADDLNTDGIYARDVTYRDDLAPEEMAAHAMRNYDPEFQRKARPGDVLVAGFNFGTGSSREQAATCLKHLGLRLVVAGSFSATYRRNAFNNGFACLECPALVADLRRRFPPGSSGSSGSPGAPTERTRRTALALELDLAAGEARLAGAVHPLAPLGPAAQELLLAGGLEKWVLGKLRSLRGKNFLSRGL